MFFLSDTNNFEKQQVKVKSFIRKGRVVRSYDRSQDKKNLRNKILLGLGGAVAGAGLLGAGVLLGRKSGGIKSITQNIDVDDIATKVAAKIKTQKIDVDEIADKVISKIPKQNIDLDDVASRVVSKIPKTKEVDTQEIVDAVAAKIPKQVDSQTIIDAVEERIKKNNEEIMSQIGKQKQPNSKALYKEISEELPAFDYTPKITARKKPAVTKSLITKIKLPKNVYSLSNKKVTQLENRALSMNDVDLNSEVSKIAKRLTKLENSRTDVGNAKTLKSLLGQYKDKSRNNYQGVMGEKRLKKEIDDLLDYFKLPKDKIDDLNIDLSKDTEYIDKLSKLANRDASLLKIYQTELSKRSNSKSYESVSDSAIDRLKDLADDFSYMGEITTFSKPSNYMGDYIKFGRGRDKTPPKRKLIRNSAIGTEYSGAGVKNGRTINNLLSGMEYPQTVLT